MSVMEERVDQFNQQYVGSAAIHSVFPAYDSKVEFADIEAFAKLIYEGYDAVNDVTLDLT